MDLIFPHEHTLLHAPLAHLLVADAVDGAVFPGGEGGGVGVVVVGGGVVGEEDEALAGAAVAHVEEGPVAVPAPGESDDVAGDAGVQWRGGGVEVGAGFFRADDAEDLAAS